MFTIYEQIATKLHDCLNQALEIDGIPLVFGHVCWGVLTKPGAFRMTQIVVRPEDKLPLTKFSDKYHIDHEAAFRRHINRFGRSGTLLDWVTLWMYENVSFVSSPGSEDFEAMGELTLNVACEDGAACLSVRENALTLSRSLYDTLLPESVITRYLKTLYGDPEKRDPVHSKFAAEHLIGARAVALQMVDNDVASKRPLRTLSEYYDKASSVHERREYNKWMFMGALQTGLIYVDASRTDKSDPQGFISVGCGYDVLDTQKAEDNPLAILSAVLPKDVQEDELRVLSAKLKELLLGSIKTKISKIHTFRDRPSTNAIRQMDSDRWDSVVLEQIISTEVKKAFAVQAFPNWASALTLWLSLLTERMRDSVHEGQLLNFSFVVADKSQVADSGLFELVNLSFPENDKLLPWDANGETLDSKTCHEVLRAFQQDVGKKNYAWFQEGKYALLWDATFPSRHPQSLIRFKDSSWDIFVANTRMGKKSRATDIIGAMTYVRADSSGGVILRGRQVLSFRKRQRWNKGSGRRPEKLKLKLSNKLTPWELQPKVFERTVKIFGEALSAIADDPHGGCILVIYAKGATPTFENMGEPWKTIHDGNPLMMSRDELTSLMSMDGATGLYFDNERPKVVFRSLVQPRYDERYSPSHENPIIINTKDLQKHLDGEGSRKWSAAYAAMNQGTVLVIAVSQDGPIFAFERIASTQEGAARPEGIAAEAERSRSEEVKIEVL